MNAMMQALNTAGRGFVGSAVPMLIQSSLLILILLVANAILRTRVRAVFRYWIWMLVLVKLVLPPSLWSPISLGTWFGEKLEAPTAALLEAPELSPVESPPPELSPAVTGFLSQPRRLFVEPPGPSPLAVSSAPAPSESTPFGVPRLRGSDWSFPPKGGTPNLLNWQGLVLLVWLAVVTALLLLLAQRTFFVRGLVAQADEAGGAMLRELDECRRRLGLRRSISLRLSSSAVSPAVCGLTRPVILVPQNLASRLHGTDLQAVLFHELAHIKRGDLWINLVQTLLQIVYFYSPLLWLANALIRRIREKAVDETVLVALGEAAPQYPETLVNVAKLAFRRPALSLRLIGVVESKHALAGRIKHILNRPMPKSAKVGLLGLAVIFLIAAVLLPMAKGNVLGGWFGRDVFFRFYSDHKDATQRRIGETEAYTEYTVRFRQGEKLAVVAELYQDGQPMRPLGGKIFSDPGRPQKFSARLTRDYRDGDRTNFKVGVEVTLGPEVFRVKDVPVRTPRWYNASSPSFFYGSQIARERQGGRSYVEVASLLWLKAEPVDGRPAGPPIWIPGGADTPTVQGDSYFFLLRMLPVSQVGSLRIDPPGGEVQLPDGTILPADAAQERRQAAAEEYVLNLKRCLMREHMPVKKLLAHRYYQADGPIWLCADGIPNSSWQPKDLHQSSRPWPYLLLIDGKEYSCSQGFGPFDGVGGWLDIWDNIYVKPGDSPLRVGRHVVAYGWKDLEVVDPNEPDRPLHFDRLLSDPVAFEVVEQVPQGYYRQVYQDGWEDILRRSIQTPFSDAPQKHAVAGPLLTLSIRPLPFSVAFEIYAQAEGSERRQHAAQIATRAGSSTITTMDCDRNVEGLNWDTVGDKRWRLILVPSEKVAARNPPIHEFYGREFVADWVSFERSPQFEQHRREFEHRGNESPSAAQSAAQQRQSASTPASGLTASDGSRDSDGDGTPEKEPEALRYDFPDLAIGTSYPDLPGAFLREYRRARSALDWTQGTPTESQRAESRRAFEALSRQSGAFPIDLYAQRWVILLDWLSGRIDALQAAQRMNALGQAQSDAAQADFTRAYAAVLLARDGYLDRAHDVFVACSPTETPQWGWFVFEMNKYLERYVESSAPNVNRTVNGTIVQSARTLQEWQAIETELRVAQTAYADYIEYELLPRAVNTVTGERAGRYALIERVQIADALRYLLVGHTHCLRLGATTGAIKERYQRQIAPKILAAWQRSLKLCETEQPARDIERQTEEIKAQCSRFQVSWDSLPEWWQRIQSDAEKAPTNAKAKWVGSGKMPHRTQAEVTVPSSAPPSGAAGEPAESASERRVYLPDLEADGNGVLDLATGQLLSAEPMQRDEQYFARLGRGDILYEQASNKNGLICLRGARLQRRTETGVEPLTPDGTRASFVLYFMESVPARYRLTTAAGRQYDVTILSADDKGCTLTYDPLPSDRAAGGRSRSPAQEGARDSDGDGLSDYDEIHKYLTDPAKKDSDGDGTPDGDWNERREYTYSVRTVLRYMPPFHEEGLSDDFQDGRVLKRTDDYIEIEVVHYPFATGQESIPENRNWRQDDAQMTEYLAPGPSTNWDEAMRRDLLAALKADGIDVDTLTDKQVVQRVSRWLLDRSRYLDKAFTTWFVHFPQGKPTVYPGLEEAFRRDFERDSSNYSWTLDQHLDHEVLGKGMFYNKTHGSCTSTAVYLTTVLRALGIPTRMILAAPAVDASDPEQIPLVKKAITHNRVRLTMLPGLNRASHGTTNHIFNEVYLGNRWCRLDYTQLGCSNFGLHRFGLQTHLYTFNDLSDANLAPTWGRRYAKGEHNDVFRHDNPYTAVEVSELFGPQGKVPNPPFTAQELDPHPTPDVFAFYSPRVNVWDALVETVKSTTANKTGRYHDRESYENLFDGTWLVRPQDVVILLFTLDTPDRVPEGYEDLLPEPWPEIEAQLRQGQTVELSGKARDRNVILLAAPSAEGLKSLVQYSTLLGGPGRRSLAPGTSPAQTRVPVLSAGEPVKVAEGVAIELLGVCRHPSEGKQWWRPDGSLRDTAPYRTVGDPMPQEEGYQNYEIALRVSGPADTTILWKVPGGNQGSSRGAPLGPGDERLTDLWAYAFNRAASASLANVFVGVAGGEWQTVATHEAPQREGSYTLEGDQAVAFGGAYEKEGSTYVPITTNVKRDEMNYRVVAVDDEGALHAAESTSGSGGNVLYSSTRRFPLPLARVKALRFQTRPWAWVAYQGVSLRPGRATNVTVELQDTQTMRAASERAPGEEKVVGIGPAWEVLRDAVTTRYRGSIGGFNSDPRRCAEYFEKALSWTRPGDAFVLMFAFDQPVGVPSEYQDLLPLPWSEIESRVRKGESIKAQGQARDLTVIVLAAPTSAELETLLRQTHLLDPYRPAAAQAPSAVPSSPALARLPNGVTVELLGTGAYGSDGKPWWRPDGSPLVEAPYDGITNGRATSDDRTKAPFWLAFRVRNLPEGWEAWARCSGGQSMTSGNRPGKAGQPQEDLRWLLVEAEPNQTTCTVGCDVMGAWQTVRGTPQDIAARTNDVLAGIQELDTALVAVEVRVHFPPHGWRVLAVTTDGQVKEQSPAGAYLSDHTGSTTVYFPGLSLARIREILVQTRPVMRVEFENVPLRPSLKTEVRVRVKPEEPDLQAGPSAGSDQEKEIVLPEADRQRVILDLATGELIPLPPVGPEPEKLEQALKKLGKGDLLYDCDQGDRTLILMRGATSEQAQGDTGEPPWKGYLIRPSLPGVITVKTAEGRQYKVTILATDEKASTLKYSLISTDPGAGGGARAEPGKTGGILGFRIAPTPEEVGSELVEKYKQALTGGGRPPSGDFAWFEVWPRTTVVPGHITCAPDGKTYLLLWNDKLHVLRADGTWGLEDVREAPSDLGNRAITLTLDEKGVQLLHELGNANLRHSMAVVFEGRVIAIPFISTTLSGPGLQIIGRFTPEETGRIVAGLKKAAAQPQPPRAAEPTAAPGGPMSRTSKDSFSVYGIVTDPSGRPIAGVKVTASCGFGTLMPTGQTVTDEAGRYTLSFGPGWRDTQGTYPENVPLQAATICACKAGFYEGNLCRQGHLGMSYKMPPPEQQARVAYYAGIVLANQPYKLDFVMLPAAQVVGEMVDARATPLAGRTVVLNGDGPLYPAQNVLASVETDSSGAFVFDAVPLQAFWFEVHASFWSEDRGRMLGRTRRSIDFTIPGTWRVRLMYDESVPDRARLTIVGLLPPAPDPSAAVGTTPVEKAGEPATVLKRLLAEAPPGGAVTVPKGRYATAVEITRPVTLRGESVDECIIEVTADQPALLVNTRGQGQVTIENLTVRWQLAGKAKTELPAALLVKGSNALIRNCRFAPLGDFKHSPMAVYIDRPSKSTVDNCRFSGFDYVVCYGQGTEGTVQDCVIADCGHQGVINYDGATLTVQRNIMTGSKFHAVRCTGGVLTVKDNLLIQNANRAIYLGNKTGRGTITNNLIINNGTGISGFGGADYVIANNVVVNNSFAGIDMRDSCRFSIRNSVLVKNQRGLALFKEGTKDYNIVAANLFWSNATDVQDLEKPAGSLTSDPQFVDPNHGDFTVRGPAQAQGHGLTNPQVLKDLWQRYEQLRAPTTGANRSQTPARGAPDLPARSAAPMRSSSAPVATAQGLSGRVVDPDGRPVAGAQVGLNEAEVYVWLHNGVLEGLPLVTATTRSLTGECIVLTDADGRFHFEGQVSDPFYLLVAHEAGFALVLGNEFQTSGAIRLQRWGRIEGQLAKGRAGVDHRLWMRRLPAPLGLWQRRAFGYDTPHDADGRFVFEKIPPGWFEVGYLVATGKEEEGFTSRTPVVVKAGETAHITVGGEGRPVIGRFAPPSSHGQTVYFGNGLRTLRGQEKIEGPQYTANEWLRQHAWGDPYSQVVDFDEPRAPDYGIMDLVIAGGLRTANWYWHLRDFPRRGEEKPLVSNASWSDVNWRSYAFGINTDGSFRIEDVRPGTYELVVDLHRLPGASNPGEAFARYRGMMVVPAQRESYTDQPLDLGTLTLDVHHVGEMAPPFEAATLSGPSIRLTDYRGKFVLLNFRMWVSFRDDGDLDRLRELHSTYGGAGKLQIISLGDLDMLDNVRERAALHKIEWPVALYDGRSKGSVAEQYGVSHFPYNVLVNPEGRIIAANVSRQTLTDTVREALWSAPASSSSSSAPVTTPQGLSGRVVDPNGRPVAGAQVGLCTDKVGIVVENGVLEPWRTSDAQKGPIVETDTEGRFRFEGEPPESFELMVAAREAGFALVDSDEFGRSREIQLTKWGRIEGQVAAGREPLDNQITMMGLPNPTWLRHKREFRYQTRGADGRFVFEKVPAGWFEVGYLLQMGDIFSSLTSRTPVEVKAGQTATMKLGGEGRPVVGRFVPPAGHRGTIYFGAGQRSLQTDHPDPPRPDNYDQMTKREQQEWSRQWRFSPEYHAYCDSIWHDPNWRGYVFRINSDGTFRIEDVIPGKYSMSVWLEERFSGRGPPEEIGGYRGTIEVPALPGGRTDEPLDVGDLVLYLSARPLEAGVVAPGFEAKDLGGGNVRLADHRGRFVLLYFWQPVHDPELDRLKELYGTYAGAGKLQIIGLAGGDTLAEVQRYLREKKTDWPQIYVGATWEHALAKEYRIPGVPYLLLVDPAGKIVATRLRGEKLTDTVRDALKDAPAAASTANEAVSATLAWQRTDRYVPPDPNGFFPDDPEGGKKLDVLYQAVDKDRRSDEEILSAVRQGFRRATQSRSSILAWIGGRYIWGKNPQNAQAVEILYHAVPLEEYNAVYYGLSVLRPKSANVLRTLAELCMGNRSDEVGRILWGLGPQRAEMVPYLSPYLQDQDAERRELAEALVKSCKGELDFDQWQRRKRQEQFKGPSADQMQRIKQALLTGDSKARFQALITLMHSGGPQWDDSLLPAMQAAGADPDRRVRNEVARLAGNRWVWAAEKQHPDAIALMVQLGADSDREVRYQAVYYGLSVVRDKSEPVVRRLVELALTDHENSLYGRIVWGLRGFSKDTANLVGQVLAEQLDRAKTDVHHAASVYGLYRDVLGKEPPADWGLAHVPQHYPEDLFVLPFSAREPFQPESLDALWSELARVLPGGITAERLPLWDTNAKHICYARIRGKEQAEAVRNTVGNHPRLRAGELRPLPLATQLYLEEKHSVAPAGR